MVFNLELIIKANRIANYPVEAYIYVINQNSIWTTSDLKKIEKSVYDFLHMIIQYSKLIEKVSQSGGETIILIYKRETMLFNMFKRILDSNLSSSKINTIIDELISKKLYPLLPYTGKNRYRKLITLLANSRSLFSFLLLIYRILRLPIQTLIVKRYQRKKEIEINKITTIF